MNAPSTVGRRLWEPEVETASREEVEAAQLHGLRVFLADHATRAPFHRERAAAAGVDLCDLRSLEQLRRLPVMRKEDVVGEARRRPPFGGLLAAAAEDVGHFVETSGTSGRGHEQYVLTHEDLRGLRRMEAFGFAWAGVTAGSFVATTFPMTSKAAGRWHAMGVEAAGGAYLPLGGYDARTKLEYLEQLGVRAVIATPSYVRRLEIQADGDGVDLRALAVDALMVSAEPFTVAWAREREELWGARVYEQYGSTQRAFAWSCEEGAVRRGDRGALHCLSHLAVYEVIDPDTGEHVQPGEVGELVITPFAASAGMPLVRFASGDKVRYLGYGACPCGRPFPAIEAGFVYRYDDRLKIKGVNIEPDALDRIILGSDVTDYDAVVRIDDRGRETVTVHLEARDGAAVPPERLEQLSGALHAATGIRFAVETGAGPMERDALSGKRRRWRDLRNH